MLREHHLLTTELQKVLDMVITAASFVVAYFIKRDMMPGGLDRLSTGPNYYIVLLMIVIAWFIAFNWMGMYISYRRSDFFQFFVRIVKSVFTGLVLLNIGLYTMHMADISRLLMGIFLGVNISLLTLSRFVIFKFLEKMRQGGYNTRYVLIIGSHERATETIAAIESYRTSGYKILGCLDVDAAVIGKSVVNGHKIIGHVDELETILKNHTVDELVFSMPLKLIENAGQKLSLAESMGVKVRIIPDWQIHHLMYQPGVATIHFEDFLGLYTMSLSTTPFNEGKLFVKSVVDFIIAAIFLILISPVFIFVIFAIRAFSRGPVFYKQERLGQNGRRFMLYKFRTMVKDADKLLCELKHMNEADGPAFKIKNDPRIIPWIGTFLRKTSLDELPQLINILKGEMSLVGPRPPIPSEVDEYDIWQRRRLSIKPGLTCYWQIEPNRNELSFDEWMRLDLKYIDTWSLFNDFKLLFLTAKAVVMGSGR